MHRLEEKALECFFANYKSNPGLRWLQDRMESATAAANENGAFDQLLEIYRAAIPIIEKEIWSDTPGWGSFSRYQALFREMEQLISIRGGDDRHEFIVVIPVADRPRQLKSCLDSLLDLCRSYHYGGYADGKFNKVSVVIADDSKEEESCLKNREIAGAINDQGIEVHYFGPDEQWRSLTSINERERLSRIIGDKSRASFFHKGPSIMRNISCLKLQELAADKRNPLFYFVDSDQEFKIELNTGDGDIDPAGLNYFYHLDRIFTQSPTEILTGKVVGDPPVSPAVMAGNFLGDVISFLHRMAGAEHEKGCQFHRSQRRLDNDAAYHDMADLFGFSPAKESYQYNCPLEGAHDHSECLRNFAASLNRFFYGEHPTRKTRFSYEDVLDNLKPARTIYTGNYVLKPGALKYFIPFATLRLRMAGPALGRIIKSEMKGRFISANLPMLHRRTVQETGQSEFRPGVEKSEDAIDLSGEFERQFFGDVMLFSIEKLTEMGFPAGRFPREFIEETVNATEREMFRQYSEKHGEIVEKLKVLEAIIDNGENWWDRLPGLEAAKHKLELFFANMERNFGTQAKGYALIGPGRNNHRRKLEIVEALMAYPADRRAWEEALSITWKEPSRLRTGMDSDKLA